MSKLCSREVAGILLSRNIGMHYARSDAVLCPVRTKFSATSVREVQNSGCFSVSLEIDGVMPSPFYNTHIEPPFH